MNKQALELLISQLPKGYISHKNINGTMRHYLQWMENGKLKSKYIKAAEYSGIVTQIEERKALEKQLKEIKEEDKAPANTFTKMNVIVGKALLNMVETVKAFKHRYCYAQLTSFLKQRPEPRICSIYGLRRTGKTTMLLQAIAELDKEDFYRAAYIKVRKDQTMAMLDADLKLLYEMGFRYIFIDEVTWLEDFIDTASLLSDIYAAMGMKIVLSGTDSLGFWLAAGQELYDRTYMIHTTWISFKEHSFLLGTEDIDEYIRFGGTLKAGETDFDNEALLIPELAFKDDEATRRYIDTAIAKNIQNSLKGYENGSHFRHLLELYEADELTNAINRIIEDMNHRFVMQVLTRDFQSQDLKLSRKKLLEIKNQYNTKIKILPEHIAEIEQYLTKLDLINTIELRSDINTTSSGKTSSMVVLTQPGMRYCQAQVLIHSIMKDEYFNTLSKATINYITEKILSEIKGRMLEEIVLLETKLSLGKNYEVFKLQFARGEYDMVVYDKQTNTCKIYEIKHSKELVEQQYQHLVDEEKLAITEYFYGKITDRVVLYRGESQTIHSNLRYINVTEYLKGNMPKVVNADKMSDSELERKLQEGYSQIKAGRTILATDAFEEFYKNHK